MGQAPPPRRPEKSRYRAVPGPIALLATLLMALPLARADSWVDTHDAPDPAWELGPQSDSEARLVSRTRVRRGTGGEGIGAERLEYVANPGGSARFWRRVPPAVAIEELGIEIEASSNRPGLLVLAEARLPRSIDPKTGEPHRLVTRQRPKSWSGSGVMRVTLDGFPLRLEREARALRLARPDETIDARGAYITRIGIVVGGGRGPGRLEVRRLRMEGVVSPSRQAIATSDGGDAAPRPSGDYGGTRRPTKVTLRSDGFRIDGKTFFPRVWRWRGESFQTLARRGMNTVWLEETPTESQLAEAAELRLRLIAPPPTVEAARERAPSWESVLAWAPAGKLDATDLDTQLVTIDRCRSLPAAAQRPVLAYVSSEAHRWGRLVDGLMIDVTDRPWRRTEHTHGSLDLRLSGLAPGTPVIGVSRVDIGLATQRQLDAFFGDSIAPAWLPPSDVATAVLIAQQRGVRGMAYLASEPLEGADNATMVAAGWLEAINRQLRLIEPWLVSGRVNRLLSDAQSDEIPGVMIERDGVRLTLTPSLPAAEPVGAVLPGVGEVLRSYRLTPAGLSSWTTERVSGGLRVAALGGGSPGALLLCNDPRIVKSLRGYTAQNGLAAARNLTAVADGLLRLSPALDQTTKTRAQKRVAQAKLALARRDAIAAYDAAHEAIALVESITQTRRSIAQQGDLLQSGPLAILPATLTDHFRLEQLLASASRGPNLLHGGSFEDIDRLRSFGWRRPSDKTGGLVELASGSSIHGERRLRIASGDDALPGTEGPRIVSPPIDLAAGQTVEITGWVRLSGARAETRLRVRDSLGGDELQLAVAPNDSWRAFRLLRRASDATTLWVTLALAGGGEAEIDGMMVRAIEPIGVARRGAAQAK